MPQKYLQVGDVATLIHHRGPTTLPGLAPDTGRGSTIICLHDAGYNGRQFDDLSDRLAAGASPLAYDQPGHGRSGSLDALPSVAAMVDHLASIVTTWSLDDPVLIGDGLGAAVALEAASRYPDRVRGLVLLGGAASYELDEEIAALAAITSGKARRDFPRNGYAPDTDRAVYQKAFGNWVPTDPRATLGARRAQADWALADPPSAVPTMVVVGEHEDEPSAAGATALAERLAGATVTELAGAGRHGVLEQPETLGATIADFAATLENGARS
ncbi:MAG: alpha/beta fold hydrolase [Acidimicrobiales bacterium]